MTAPTPNVALLRQTLAKIEALPDLWNQHRYRCGTGMCIAGWGCELAGGRWLHAPDGFWPDLLVAETGDDPEIIRRLDDRDVIDVGIRARRIFGLTYSQAEVLFDAENDLDDLRRIVGELCAGAES